MGEHLAVAGWCVDAAPKELPTMFSLTIAAVKTLNRSTRFDPALLTPGLMVLSIRHLLGHIVQTSVFILGLSVRSTSCANSFRVRLPAQS